MRRAPTRFQRGGDRWTTRKPAGYLPKGESKPITPEQYFRILSKRWFTFHQAG